jgi:hypothetical protein
MARVLKQLGGPVLSAYNLDTRTTAKRHANAHLRIPTQQQAALRVLQPWL